jgi:hypothetical protein
MKADSSINDIVGWIAVRHHSGLHDASVTVECLMAFAAVDAKGEPRGHAIKHHGYPALAKIRVLPLKDRVAGRADAEMLIDGKAWDDMEPDRREALIDGQLERLEIQLDKEGAIKSDDIGRPKLKLKQADWHLEGFAAVAQRHGEASAEVQHAKALAAKYGQLLFTFMRYNSKDRSDGSANANPDAADVAGVMVERAAKKRNGQVTADDDAIAGRIAEKVAESINAGAMDTPGMKMTATVSRARESSGGAFRSYK